MKRTFLNRIGKPKEAASLMKLKKLLYKLYVSLGSIKAGNNSIKLKNQVFSLLDSLVDLGEINKKQKKKIVREYIDQ